jgi:shikimate kinase
LKIVLIGYRTSGKSTVGQLLSQQLAMPYLDIDRGIEERIGDQTLTEYFLEVGDEVYRRLEAEIVAKMCAQDHCVIAFGAGSLKFPASREAARRNALVVYLQVPTEELWRRFQSDPLTAETRPNLAGGGIGEIEEMLAQREPVYLECADLVIDGTRPPEALATEVVTTYQAKSTD